jgi:hypothetical protein
MKKKVLALVLTLILLAAMLPIALAADTPAAAQQAVSNFATVTFDGKAVTFDSYVINQETYFKLRDLAYKLSGTAKQFGVGWDGEKNAISLTTGQTYVPDGSEMAGKSSGTRTAAPTSSKIYLDGKEVTFTAYTIGQNNYFRLRDIGKTFNFGVAWDDAGKTVMIDTSKTYTVDTAAARSYTNIYFDYSKEIAAYNAKTTSFTMPTAANIGITVADEKGATGVELVAAAKDNKTDYYLNAFVAGNKLTFTGSDIKSAADQIGKTTTNIAVSNGQFTITPRPISAGKPVDEIIVITKSNKSVCNIHMVNEFMPTMNITTGTVKPQDGVYSFTVDRFILRVGTDGNIVYYRNMGFLSSKSADNFKPQDTQDGRFYSYFVELNTSKKGTGFLSGMYIIMDKNYNEINYVTLAANSDKNHTHGEGYLDDHEFLMLGKDHWISLSNTPMFVSNLKGNGISGGNTAYVQAGIIQEVQNGQVIHEYNSVDYPELYAAAKENTKYSTSSGTKTPNDYMDYVHMNSVSVDPKDGNLVVSMRSQYAVYKFNRETGDIMWVLGGALNSFSGLDSFKDAGGNLFVGQHYAMYVSSSIAGNDSTITVFDNHTNYSSNTTRVFEFVLDETNKTASATVIKGSDLDKLTAEKHWATHCGAYERQTNDSCYIGWGANGSLDGNNATIPTHALLTDYNIISKVITFELSITRNSHYTSSKDSCYSYRTYKNVD